MIRVACLLLLISCLGWFFTLTLDLSLIIIFAYPISFLVYRLAKKQPWMGKWAWILILVSVLALWSGGIPPYFNLMEPEDVYFGMVPSEWLGENGNDFMWNGLTLPIIGRIVPLEMTPTYQFPLFTIYAVFVWLMMPFAMIGVARFGRADAQADIPWQKIFFPELGRMFLLAAAVFISNAANIKFLVWIYS